MHSDLTRADAADRPAGPADSASTDDDRTLAWAIEPPLPPTLIKQQLRERPGDLTAGQAASAGVAGALRGASRAARRPAWGAAIALCVLLSGVAATLSIVQWRRAQLPSAPAAAGSEARAGDRGAPPASAAPPAPLVSPAPRVPPASLRVPAPEPADRFAGLLARAERALNEGRIALPQGDNALDYYRVVLVTDPNHAEAADGLDRVLDALYAQAERALLENALENVETVLAAVRRAEPESGRLAFLEVQLGRARAQAGATPARTAEPRSGAAAFVEPLEQRIAQLQAETERLRRVDALVTIRERLASHALVTPAGDSAFDYLSALAREDPASEELPALWNALTSALADEVRRAIARGEWVAAERWVAALERTGRVDAAAATFRRQIETQRLQEQYLANAAPASELGIVSYAPPVYPGDAVARGIEGWVDLEFVVDRSGRVRDIVAAGAEPQGRFEQAAIAAVESYRYLPFVRDGVAYERRIRLRIRFSLE